MTTMLQAVCGTPEVFTQMEPALVPLIARCTQKDAQDFFEDVLDVRAILGRVHTILGRTRTTLVRTCWRWAPAVGGRGCAW
eukprot:2318018-Prymnesium_polylepis.1